MNLKKTAIALAVATVAATPILASADGSVYASARYGLNSLDNGTDRVTTWQNFGSRWGIKGETDLGDGMSAFGHWEAHMIDEPGLRDYKIGVKGDFGMVYMGDSIDHAWDSHLSSDITWWYGGTQHLNDGVQSNAITYMNDFGVVSFAATAQMTSDGTGETKESVDQLELAVAFDAGPVNVALGMTDPANEIGADDPDATFGVLVKGEAGGVNYSVEFQTGQVAGTVLNTARNAAIAGAADATSYQFEVAMNGFYAQYGAQEVDVAYGSGTTANVKAAESSALVLGYTYNIGPRTLMYFEYRDHEVEGVAASNGAVTSTDGSVFAAVLKYDIL